jgi:O-antigen/teichoic acid export membrane protein
MHEQYGRKLTQNMIAGAAAAVLNCALTLLSYPVYLHFLGYAEYGKWMLASTFVALCQLGSLGIAPAMSKLIAEEFGQGNRNGAQRYVELAFSLVIVLGVGVVGLVFLFQRPILRYFDLNPGTAQTAETLLPFVLIMTAYAFLTDVCAGVLLGLGRMDLSSAIQTATQVVAFGSSFLLLKNGFGVVSLAVGTVASLLLMHILMTVAVWRVGSLVLKPAVRLDWIRGRNLLRLASTVFATSIASTLFVPLNKLLLSKYVGVAALPVYEIAFSTSMRIRSLFEMALRPIMPVLSHAMSLEASQLKAELYKVHRNARRVLLLAAGVFGFVFLFADPILRMWLRHSLDPSLSGALSVMLAGAFISLVGVPAYYALLGLGRAGILFWSHVLQSATNIVFVVFGLILGYPLSLMTLLIASSISMGVSTCYLLTQYSSKLRSLNSRDYVRSSVHCDLESVSSVAPHS